MHIQYSENKLTDTASPEVGGKVKVVRVIKQIYLNKLPLAGSGTRRGLTNLIYKNVKTSSIHRDFTLSDFKKICGPTKKIIH
jgi:hypothetical protein